MQNPHAGIKLTSQPSSSPWMVKCMDGWKVSKLWRGEAAAEKGNLVQENLHEGKDMVLINQAIFQPSSSNTLFNKSTKIPIYKCVKRWGYCGGVEFSTSTTTWRSNMDVSDEGFFKPSSSFPLFTNWRKFKLGIQWRGEAAAEARIFMQDKQMNWSNWPILLLHLWLQRTQVHRWNIGHKRFEKKVRMLHRIEPDRPCWALHIWWLVT